MEWSAESANHAAHHLHYRGRQVITLQGLETLLSPSVQLEDILYEARRTNLELLSTLLRLLVMRGSQKLVQHCQRHSSIQIQTTKLGLVYGFHIMDGRVIFKEESFRCAFLPCNARHPT